MTLNSTVKIKNEIGFYQKLTVFCRSTGCHQIHERSFSIKGTPFPICARCTGVLAGNIIAYSMFFFYSMPLEFCIFGCFIMFADWYLQYLGIRKSTNIRRLITGIIGGYSLTTAFLIIIKKLGLFGLTITIISLVFAGCFSAPETAENRQAPRPSGPFYTGDGGKDMSLAVLEPAGRGISSNDRWMLSLVQGSLTSDFNRYSAITVVDRQNLDTVLAEQRQSMSGDYSNDDFISIGKLANARLILSGSITRTANTFMMELSVTDVQDGLRKASYGPASVTPAAIENLSAMRTAAADLLNQLGVALTESGQRELASPAAVEQVQGQTALARGVTAQRGGSVAAALNYFSEAAFFDSGLSEAAGRLASLSAQIESGNIGDNIRNEIQRRDAWVKLLEEAVAFYNNYPIADLVINTNIRQGGINFSDRTAKIGFTVWPEPNARLDSMYKILRAAYATGKIGEWGLGQYVAQLFNQYDGGAVLLFFKAELSGGGVYLADGYNYLDFRLPEADGRPDFALERVTRNNTLSYVTLRPTELDFTAPADSIGNNMEIVVTQAIRVMATADRTRFFATPYLWTNNNPAFLSNLRLTFTDKSFEDYFARRPNYRLQSGQLRYFPPTR